MNLEEAVLTYMPSRKLFAGILRKVLIYHINYQAEDDATLYSYGIDLDARDGSLVDTSMASLPKR